MSVQKVREPLSEEAQTALQKYPEIVHELLFARDITTTDVEVFLHPDYDRDMHDPWLLKNMEKAVLRICEAAINKERIVIYSDFDADGIPGAVVLHDFFAKIGAQNVSVRIPHRNTEGFGLNERVIQECIADGVRLLITIDCGMGDAVHVAEAQKYGIDVIVTDHHLPNHVVPDAYAIINPNQEEDTYPNKNLCGAGVIFKVVQALVQKMQEKGLPIQEKIPVGWEKWLLDMVGIATLSDMVSLTGENRALAYYGLTVLRKSRRIGLRRLCEKLRINQKALTEDDVVFMITPRINVASRMDEPETAFRLLATTNEQEAETLVNYLNTLNNERKGVVASMTKEIKKRVTARTERSVIVVGDPHWKPGLLGLVATATVGVFRKPVFVWGRGDADVIKGSVRSDGSVDVNLLMTETTALFLEHGGHVFSGGFSVAVDKVHLLEDGLNEAYERIKMDTPVANEVVIDKKLSLDAVSRELHESISLLAPFGTGNPKPYFLFEHVTPITIERFGKSKEHIKLVFQKSNGEFVSAVQFFVDEDTHLAKLQKGESCNVVASLEKSEFGRTREIRLRISTVS